MRIFISWSGERSRQFALHLHQWLTDVNSMFTPWMSATDIEAGERWGPAIDAQLAETTVGVLCLTSDNLAAPWLMFEAGALAKAVEVSRVCPLLLNLEPTDLPAGPLTRFQAKRATRDGVFDVLTTINRAMTTGKLTDPQLVRVFDRWWPDLEEGLRTIPAQPPAASARSDSSVLREVLDHVRTLTRRATEEDHDVDYKTTTSRGQPLRLRFRNGKFEVAPDQGEPQDASTDGDDE